jgi:DNA-directed RNA polymerase subunit N (RpoN/RPB10)
MSFNGCQQQQQQHNHQLLQYFCSKCGILLKEEEESLIDNKKIVLTPATATEQCLKCGSLLSSKNLIRKFKLKESNTLEEQQHLSSSLLLRRTSEELLFPKFQTAYYDIEDRKRKITLDIEEIDSSITLTTEDCIGIIGEARYANTILIRLCVRALILKSQSELLEFAKKVIFIDAGGKNNSPDSFYRCVNFARQYRLDIKKVLQSIVVSRAFTIYQLADLIIYELPRVIQQLEAKVILISDLLNMFVCDPQIKIEEGERMIKEIINSLRKISSTTNNTLIVVSLCRHHHYSSFSSSYLYEKILLPRFDKCIEITNSKKKKVNNVLDIRIRNHKNHHHNDGISKNSCRRFSLSERDLIQLILPTR